MSDPHAVEEFWRGSFGDDYTLRNESDRRLHTERIFFERALRSVSESEISSILELGAGAGHNLAALARRYPDAHLSAVEINPSAAAVLRRRVPAAEVFEQATSQFTPNRRWDLVVVKGFLIHVPPAQLAAVYDVMARSAVRFILVAEYYSPTPVELPYRGHSGKLFKRDFAGELLDRYPTLKLVDYGFAYHRDPECPQDDLNWFLLATGGRCDTDDAPKLA